MSRAHRKEEDALDLISWYEKQTSAGTWLTDAQIAADMKWIDERNGEGYPQVKRIRDTRRFVDHDQTGLFAEYWFGTRTNGSGKSWSQLHRPNVEDQNVDGQVAEEVMRSCQAARALDDEMGRRILPTLRKAEERLQEERKVAAAIAVHDAVRDLETIGRIRHSTLAQIHLMFSRPTGSI